MKERSRSANEQSLTRRHFIKGSAGAIVAASCFHESVAHAGVVDALLRQGAPAKYVCPPCGLPCDKLTFDKPGNCPQCGMQLIPAGDSDEGPPRVAILVYGGTELIDIAGPWEAFGTAGFRIHTVAQSREPITLVFGQKMIPDYTIEDAPKSEIL